MEKYLERLDMKIDEFGIEQPHDDKILLRYMDKWKFDSLLKKGLVFTKAEKQEDKNDCVNLYKDTGYTRRENYVRKFKLLSCWTLDKKYCEDKILEYCSFTDKENNKSDYAYVVLTTYRKLLEFIELKCGRRKIHKLIFRIRFGNVKYIDLNTIIGSECNGVDNSPFLKDKNLFEHENEFRLFMELGSSVNKYDEQIRTQIPQTDYCQQIEWLQGNPKDFLTDVYEYNKNTGDFNLIGIPYVVRETVEPRLFKPHTLY